VRNLIKPDCPLWNRDGAICGAHFNARANEWGKLHNDELQYLFQRPNVPEEIKNKEVWFGQDVPGGSTIR